MTSEELRRKLKADVPASVVKKAESVEESVELVEGEEIFEGDSGDPTIEDLLTAFGLLRQAMHLLDYMSDEILAPTIGVRERKAFEVMSTRIDGYLDEVEDSYTELLEGIEDEEEGDRF